MNLDLPQYLAIDAPGVGRYDDEMADGGRGGHRYLIQTSLEEAVAE